jgi:hypothetical protein
VSASSGCLDEPPTFAPRGQIPPFIIGGQVEPPLGAVYEGPFPIPMNVPFRSEDANYVLQARLYLDLVPGTGRRSPDLVESIAAGIFEDTSRSVSMDWTAALDGCHSLTLILTWGENFDNVSGLPRDDSRAARVVWWVNGNDAEGTATLSSCPGATQREINVP